MQAQELACAKQIRRVLVVDTESPRSTRHSLSHAPHSQNAEDFAADLPSQEHVGAHGLPRSGSNQFLSFVSSTRSAQ